MGKHLSAGSLPVQSSQEAHPGKAVNRTLLVAVLSAFPVLNATLAMTLQELQPYVGTVPGWVFAVLNGALLVTTVLIGIFTRVMAIPAVSDWFRRYVPALAPDSEPPVSRVATPVEQV